MSTLTKAAEAKLLQALEKTADLVNDGNGPNEAIAKAAQAHGVPPGHLGQMVVAYNIGRTNRQRTGGDSILEKTADFELADLGKIKELLYPAHVKTAAAVAQEAALSTEYAVSPDGMLARRQQREKRAMGVDWRMVDKPPDPYPGDPVALMKKAHSQAQRQRKTLEEARRRAGAAFDKMGHTFIQLTDHFRSPSSLPIPTVREQVMLMHGGRGEQIMDQLMAVTPGLGKMSHHKQAVDRHMPADGVAYALVSQLLDEVDQYKTLNAEFTKLAARTAKEAEVLLSPFACPTPSVLDDPGQKRAAAPFSLQSIMTGISDTIEPPAGGADSTKTLDALTDPHHEAQLRHIRAEATLHDLILNDPIISSYDPHQTIHAYNSLVDASPRLADQRLMLQPLLRSHLQRGSLDPFEMDQLLGMENKMQKRDSGVYGETTRQPAGGNDVAAF